MKLKFTEEEFIVVDEIDIVYAADENYNKQLAVSINSLFQICL